MILERAHSGQVANLKTLSCEPDGRAATDIGECWHDFSGYRDEELGSVDEHSRYKDVEFRFLSALISIGKPKLDPTISARRLLHNYGTLAKALSAPPEDLSIVLGEDIDGAKQIKSYYRTIVRTIFAQVEQNAVLDYDAINEMVLWTIGNCAVEQVQLFYLDKRQRVTGTEIICSGSEAFVSVSVRTIISSVLRKNAAAFIVAHNHPGGSVEPSSNDFQLTERLLKASSMVEIRLVESMIVSGNRAYSFRANGHL